MFLLATLVSAVTSPEPLTRVSELPDLASMALLSVVFAGASAALRRTRGDGRGRRERGVVPRT